MKVENISMGNMQSGRDGEVLAAPPLFLEESGHSGGIPVDSGGMKFSRRLCSFIYSSVFHSGGFWNLHWNGVPQNGVPQNPLELFICLLFICDQ